MNRSTSLIIDTESATSEVGVGVGAPLVGSITSLESLREHLQWAIELEHSTIPPYLCALYSIESGRNLEAVEVISSVLVEEILHMTLAANLLNAVGGRPRLAIPRMLPGYPRLLPHCDRSFEVSIFRFGPEAIDAFLKIEQPSPTGVPPESNHYAAVGQFYDAIKRGLRRLSETLGEANVFCGDPTRQVTDQHFHNSGRRLIAIDSLAAGLAALEKIVEQGKGGGNAQFREGDSELFYPQRDQVAGYYRLQELKLGRRYRRGDTPRSGPTGDSISIDWDSVRPMETNPRICKHSPGSPIRAAQEKFNQCYYAILQFLEEAFRGAPHTLGSAIGAMYALKVQAQALMQMPTQDGLATAGPTFEYCSQPWRKQEVISTSDSPPAARPICRTNCCPPCYPTRRFGGAGAVDVVVRRPLRSPQIVSALTSNTARVTDRASRSA